MKKRINSTSSLHKGHKIMNPIVRIDIKPSQQEAHHHQTRCPLPKPIRPAPTTVPPFEAIKQLKTPILSNLRTRIANFMSSADRMLQYVQTDQKHSRKIYQEDRKNLLQYLNSLVVRQIRPAHFNCPQSLPHHQVSDKKVSTQALGGQSEQIEKMHSHRKRCKSYNQKEQEKAKYFSGNNQKMEQEDLKERCPYPEAELVKCQTDLETKCSFLIYAQLVLCKSMLTLHEFISQKYQANQAQLAQQSKLIFLATSLAEAINYLHSQSNIPTIQRLKQEAQSMIFYFHELRRTSNLIPSKECILKRDQQWLAYKEKVERQFVEKQDELRGQMRRLTEEVGSLTEDLQRWESEAKMLKEENQSLREDLRSMEQHNQQVRCNYSEVCYQLEEANNSLKTLQQVYLAKNDQLIELSAEFSKKSQIISQNIQQIQQKQIQISRLQDVIRDMELSKAQSQTFLRNSTNELSQQLITKQRQIKEIGTRLKLLEENYIFLEEEGLRSRWRAIDHQTKTEALELENRTLYNDVRESERIQSRLEEDKHTYQVLNKQLGQQCNSYRQQIQECHNRIRFWEEKVLELAQLTECSIVEKFTQEEKFQVFKDDSSGLYMPFMLHHQIQFSNNSQDTSRAGQADVFTDDEKIKASTLEQKDNYEMLCNVIDQKENSNQRQYKQIIFKDTNDEQSTLMQIPFQFAQKPENSHPQVLLNPLIAQQMPQLINPESIRFENDSYKLIEQVCKPSYQKNSKIINEYASEKKSARRPQSHQKRETPFRRNGNMYIRVRKDGAESSTVSRPRSMSCLHSQI